MGPENNDGLGIVEGKAREENGARERKKRGVDSDGEPQGYDDGKRESLTAKDSPETVDQVLKEELHGVPLLKKDTFLEAAALLAASSSNPRGDAPKPFIFFGLMAYGSVAIIAGLCGLARAVALGIS
jgi:hypothetical protein